MYKCDHDRTSLMFNKLMASKKEWELEDMLRMLASLVHSNSHDTLMHIYFKKIKSDNTDHSKDLIQIILIDDSDDMRKVRKVISKVYTEEELLNILQRMNRKSLNSASKICHKEDIHSVITKAIIQDDEDKKKNKDEFNKFISDVVGTDAHLDVIDDFNDLDLDTGNDDKIEAYLDYLGDQEDQKQGDDFWTPENIQFAKEKLREDNVDSNLEK